MHAPRWGWLLCLATACGAPAAGDAGATDSGVPGDAGPWYPSDLPVVQIGAESATDHTMLDPATAMPAMLACVGQRARPVGAGGGTLQRSVRDFQTGMPIPNACVRMFTNDIVSDAQCDASAVHADASGQITFDEPMGGAPIAFEVFPIDNTDPSLRYVLTADYDVPSGGPDQILGLSAGSLNLIPLIAHHTHTAGTGYFGGNAVDCMNTPIYGMVFRIADADGHYLVDDPARSGFFVGYFDGAMRPSGVARWTQSDGIFYAANVPVPPDGRPYFIEGWGRLHAGEPPVVLHCMQARAFPDGMSILFREVPRYSDGPSCPGLSAGP